MPHLNPSPETKALTTLRIDHKWCRGFPFANCFGFPQGRTSCRFIFWLGWKSLINRYLSIGCQMSDFVGSYIFGCQAKVRYSYTCLSFQTPLVIFAPKDHGFLLRWKLPVHIGKEASDSGLIPWLKILRWKIKNSKFAAGFDHTINIQLFVFAQGLKH